MKNFRIIAPADLAHASQLLTRPNHAAIGGGVDTIDLLKQQIIAPEVLVNLKGLAELGGIETRSDGSLRLGALVKLSDVAEHPYINEHFQALAEAAGEAATPQIRNLASVGGNLLQRPRCWYFRNALVPCLKKGGDKCYSIGGLNRYHSILGGGPSFIVHPSNLAPALCAFHASIKIVGPEGARSVELEKFFTLPTVDPTRENSLRKGEVIVEVIVPPAPRTRSTYLEIREKQSFDWPLVSVAAVTEIDSGGAVTRADLVMGAVAPIPWRAAEAEQIIKASRKLDRALAIAAAEAALKDAQPMSDNAYKVKIAKVLMRRAILKTANLEDL